MMLSRISIVSLLAVAGCASVGRVPVTGQIPVTDVHHGVSVTEAYRWLEDWDNPDVRAWSEEQNRYARGVLGGLPNVSAIRDRVTEILAAETTSYYAPTYRAGHFFTMKDQPPKQQPFLMTMASLADLDNARVLVDPNVLDPTGSTSIDWYVPDFEGKLVAVSLSQGGSESGDVHIYETATGRRVYEIIPRVNGGTAGGDVAWSPDGSGFFYTRYPRDGERPDVDMSFYQQLYYHELGTPTESDRYELGKDFPRIAEIQLDMDRKTGRVLTTVQNGDGGEFAHYLRFRDGTWRQFSRFGDRTLQAAFGPHDDLFVLSRLGAPRGRILRVTIPSLDVKTARTIVPQGDDTIVSSFGGSTILPTESRLYVQFQVGGPSEIRVFDHQGKPVAAPEQLPVSSVGGMKRLTGDSVLFSNSSYIEPNAYYAFNPQTGKTVKTRLGTDSPVEFDDVTVVREFATSKDGTKVPLNIIMPKSAQRDGTNPCVVTGYGGFNISRSPRFRSLNRILFDQGVIYVSTNLRGGSEYGAQWHEQGCLTKKQNVFDDFAAVLEHVIDRKYTSREKLAITGGSNGGLLMGATLVQHPELVKTVVTHVGIYDMLRVELSSNGAFNIPEYGTVKDPDQFRALRAYSPYHNVEDGTPYPATLFLTGANDPRVDPMQSRKMTARLQAATSSDAPILLRTSHDTGHGGAPLAARIEENVDVYAFLFHQLGLDFSDR